MNILVLGGGGREHAIGWALAKSPKCEKLYLAPGNGGTAGIAENVAGLNAEDGAAVLAFAQEHAIDLVVIGPEAPLVAGVADVLRAAGIPVFGPSASCARLEGSKSFSKEFMLANGLPTAEYGAFDTEAEALAYLDEHAAPIVVKADGLAAGKGV
ncbi:MAG: phosphoribosylamine--glycine ligase, partial [Coriobacteriaceae bacterium]|nr:phosphoribosylamine--glycine ligase [Coriobacteriaceae bacterium]